MLFLHPAAENISECTFVHLMSSFEVQQEKNAGSRLGNHPSTPSTFSFEQLNA